MKSESFDENGIETEDPLQTLEKVTICNSVNLVNIRKINSR